MTDRVIVLLDMDCFYVQVEERDYPYIKGKPAAVVQYNAWKGGGIIAVNYEARDCGVKRSMRGDEAKEKCSSIHLVTVPVQRGKADLTKYRNAGSEVLSVLCEFSDSVERASIDEAYIDLTKVVHERYDSLKSKVQQCDLKSTWIVGYGDGEELDDVNTCQDSVKSWINEVYCDENEFAGDGLSSRVCDQKLAIAATICEEMRAKILETTGFKCSAGISHNKILGKLACGLHKPNQQTVLPMKSVPGLWSKLPISKIRNLGGKLGYSVVNDFKCKTMGDLSVLTLSQLQSRYEEKTAIWLYSIGKGIDNEPVTARLLAKSIGCGKNFIGKESLNQKEKVYVWMKNLSDELSERLEDDKKKNRRIATTLTVQVRMDVENSNAISRSTSLTSYKTDSISRIALNLIQHTNTASSKTDKWIPALTNISLSAGKFMKMISGNANIKDLFSQVTPSLNNSNVDSTYDKNVDSFSVSEIEYDNVYDIDSTVSTSFCIDDPVKIVTVDSARKSCKSENSQSSVSNVDDIAVIDPHSTYEPPRSPVITSKSSKNSFFLNYLAKKRLTDDLVMPTCKDIGDQSNEKTITVQEEQRKVNREQFRKTCINNRDTNTTANQLFDNFDSDNCNSHGKNDTLNSRKDIASENEPDIQIINAIINSQTLHNKSTLCDKTDSLVMKSSRNTSKNGENSKGSLNFISFKNCTDEATLSFDINELFPDLSNIDSSVLALLPNFIQRKVAAAVNGSKLHLTTKCGERTDTSAEDLIDLCGDASVGDDKVSCDKCDSLIHTSNYVEHTDYHFAVSLRKEQIEETKKEILSHNKKSKDSPAKKSKRARLKPEGKNVCKFPKIDSFFHKSHSGS